MMVHITGDTHGEIDSHKLTVKNFPQQKLMTKSDSLIVCGDFGCVWDGSKNDKSGRNGMRESLLPLCL